MTTRKSKPASKAAMARTIKRLDAKLELCSCELDKYSNGFENMRRYWQEAHELNGKLKVENEILRNAAVMRAPRDPTPEELIDAAIAFMVIGMDNER